MRADTFHLEQRRVIYRGLVELGGMLDDELADHLEMAELLHRDVLEHVANAGVGDMERLHPVLQGRGQFPGGTAELLQQELAEARVRCADIDRHDGLFVMDEHRGNPS